MLLQLSTAQLLWKEEVIARGDDAVEAAPTRDTVIGVRLVVTPRIVREHRVGPVLADNAADLAAQIHADLELTVLLTEEHKALDPDRGAGRALLAFAHLRHLR